MLAKKREAVSFCRSCGFVCQLCKQIHQEWEDFSNHEVISLATLTEDITAIVSPLKKTVFCCEHPEKEAELLYCDTCAASFASTVTNGAPVQFSGGLFRHAQGNDRKWA